jgi:hypothetical protein
VQAAGGRRTASNQQPPRRHASPSPDRKSPPPPPPEQHPRPEHRSDAPPPLGAHHPPSLSPLVIPSPRPLPHAGAPRCRAGAIPLQLRVVRGRTYVCIWVVGFSVGPSVVVGRDWSPVSSQKVRGCCCRTPGGHRATPQLGEGAHVVQRVSIPYARRIVPVVFPMPVVFNWRPPAENKPS